MVSWDNGNDAADCINLTHFVCDLRCVLNSCPLFGILCFIVGAILIDAGTDKYVMIGDPDAWTESNNYL